MFGIGFGEFILILVVALIFISPEKLPEIAGMVVKTYREIRRAGLEFKRGVTEIAPLAPEKASPSEKRGGGGVGGAAGGYGPSTDEDMPGRQGPGGDAGPDGPPEKAL